MPASLLIVTFTLLAGAASALRRKGRNDLITQRPYNNRHSDASAARDERALLS
jgi:hypothetical protein